MFRLATESLQLEFEDGPLALAIEEGVAALAGDSNDREHDALFDLLSELGHGERAQRAVERSS